MDKLQINNITYVVQREFVGEKTPSDLIRERIRQAHCQSLPLTAPASHVYNSGESTSTTRGFGKFQQFVRHMFSGSGGKIPASPCIKINFSVY